MKSNKWVALNWPHSDKYVSIIDENENRVQATFCCWLDYNYPNIPFFAVPNGGYRNKVTAYILKQTGVKAGIPDLVFPIKRGFYNCLYIEVKKSPRGTVSKEQKEWHKILREEGNRVCVAHGFKECLSYFEEYINTS